MKTTLLLITTLLIVGCTKEEIPAPPTPTLKIGQSYQGGVIAYILQPNDPGYDPTTDHGIIAAPSDQSSDAEWGCNGTLLSGADGIAIGTGNQNTIDIIAGCSTPGIAARLCGDLTLNGYSDWYLPSKDELKKLFLNRTAIGGFVADEYVWYWSSTQEANNGAWVQNFANDLQGYTYKYVEAPVRAIRSF